MKLEKSQLSAICNIARESHNKKNKEIEEKFKKSLAVKKLASEAWLHFSKIPKAIRNNWHCMGNMKLSSFQDAAFTALRPERKNFNYGEYEIMVIVKAADAKDMADLMKKLKLKI